MKKNKQKKELYFKVKCTKTQDDRFNLGEIYNMYIIKKQTSDHHLIMAEIHMDCTSVVIDGDILNPEDVFKAWYKNCRWRDYDFEYIAANEYVVELL